MSTRINWGILGYARIARMQMIPAIAASGNGRVHAIASRNPDTLAAASAQALEAKTYERYAELINDPDIQAIYIPLPNALHRQWAIAALDAGKHVLCEKPLALSADEAREMRDAAYGAGRLLMEAFMYRYSDRTRQVQAVLASGVLGEIHHANISFRFLLDRPDSIKMQPELGAGALYDVGVYPINLLGLIAGGAQPVAVHAEGAFEQGIDVNASVLLRYESGLLATIHCGFNAFGQMGAEIIGSKGRLQIPEPFLGEAGTLTLTTAEGTRSIEVAATDRYTEQVQDFAAAILEHRQPLLSLAESIRNLEVLDMIRASLKAH